MRTHDSTTTRRAPSTIRGVRGRSRDGARRRTGAWVAVLLVAALVASTPGAPAGAAPASESDRSVEGRSAALTGYERDDELRLNEIQVLGTHNSYHLPPNPVFNAALEELLPGITQFWQYEHRPLPEQFAEQGIRQIELDVFADPDGGLYANRLGYQYAGLPADPGIPELHEPGMKVLHVQEVDPESNCPTLVVCLTHLKEWSEANPGHVPVMVLVELKQDPIIDPLNLGFVDPIPFDSDLLDEVDAEIRSVFDDDHIILPDDVRGTHETLSGAITTDGWPTLGEVRGKVMFGLDNGGSMQNMYLSGHPSLQGRVMFTGGSPVGAPEAAFLKLNNPVSQFATIQNAVAQGYMVRTRADGNNSILEPPPIDVNQRDTALASGAQWVSTDFPVPDDRFDPNYQVQMPGGTPARCNPISAPEWCQPTDVENLSAVPDEVPAEPSAGCGTSAIGTGEQTITIESGGVDRTYIRYVPPAHDGLGPVPLVVAVHGFAEGSSLHRQMTEYIPLAAEEGFVVVFPQGLGSPAAWNSTLGSNDSVLMGDLLDELEADLCLDTNRLYMSGFSMGGFMSSTVACEYADRFAALAPVAGLRDPAGCAPTRPVPLISFHGTADTWVSFGPTPGNATAWADRNGCGTTPTETFVANDAENPDVDIYRLEYPCDAEGAAPVEYYRIDNGGHGWPGSDFSRAIVDFVGYTTFEIDATELIWEFFQANPMPEGETATTGTISGTVVDPDLDPASGVLVGAYGPSDVWVGTRFTSTGSDGTYELVGLEPDDYKLFVLTPPGSTWDRQWYPGANGRHAAQPITVDPGDVVTADVQLTSNPAITGTVTLQGDPVVGTQVQAFGPTDTWVGSGAAEVAADGSYVLGGLPPGDYRVRVVPPAGSGLGARWYDDTTIRAAATLVTVSSGTTATGIDFAYVIDIGL